jgi:hypothetical protein
MVKDISDHARLSLQADLSRLLRNMQQPESPAPHNEHIDSLAHTSSAVLRPWGNGKYKCPSLPKFIRAYCRIADNLTPDLIRDYLAQENGKPYSDKTIYQRMKEHGPGRY